MTTNKMPPHPDSHFGYEIISDMPDEIWAYTTGGSNQRHFVLRENNMPRYDSPRAQYIRADLVPSTTMPLTPDNAQDVERKVATPTGKWKEALEAFNVMCANSDGGIWLSSQNIKTIREALSVQGVEEFPLDEKNAVFRDCSMRKSSWIEEYFKNNNLKITERKAGEEKP